MIAVTVALMAAALQTPEAERIVVRWQELPVAKALQQEMRSQGAASPALEIVNALAWTKQRGLGFLCPAGDTPPGFADVPVADGGAFPYVTTNGTTNRLSLAEVYADIVAKEQCLRTDVKMPLRALARADGGFDYVPYGGSGGRGVRLGFDQFGGILAAGEFERRPGLVFRTKTSAGRAFGAALAEAANRLGPERLLRVGYYPTEARYPQKSAPNRKFVYAHAMQCFLLGGIPTGFAHSYPSDARTEDFAAWPPAAGPGVRTWWSERLTPHVHEPTLAAARLDLDSAARAGLDALGVLVYPGCLSPDNPWHDGIRRLCEAAETHRVKIVFDLWGTFPPSWTRTAKALYTAEHGRALKALFDRYPDAWLRIDGKVAFQFGRDLVKFGQRASDYAAFWQALGGRADYYLVCTLMDSRAHNFFNGWERLGDLSTFWGVHTGWGDKNVDWVLDQIRKDRNDRLSWGVSRGYYRANFGGRLDAGNLTEGFGACRFIDNWLEAIARDCGAVYVQSWNDLGEDHHILESNFLGDSFIRLNRHLADWFRAGREPAVAEEKLLMFHRRHLVEAKLETHPGRDPQHPSWTSAPLCDYVHVVSLLKRPGDLELRLGDETVRLAGVGAGLRDWLVLVPRTKDHGGNHPFWNGDSYGQTLPFDTDRRRVTAVAALPACRPTARLVREGASVLEVTSRTGIADRFRFHCFNVVGSVSE